MEFWQNHPKLTTVAVIFIAIGATVFLYLLSVQGSSRDNNGQPIIAHGRSGSVVAGEGGAGDIRSLNFQELLRDELAAGAALEKTLLVDVDGDGQDEAAVLLRRSGEQRPLDWFLYGIKDGQPRRLFEHRSLAQGGLNTAGATLVESSGIYAPADPLCCPSTLLRSVFAWQGGALVPTRVEMAPRS